ncbi:MULTISPECIES: hypothetical protein [Brucella]|uniref:Uncharacterized protein n=2 Tax=Brucella TaxID=234 RepID=A6WZU3_BRUA4|nr:MULTISPECIES: hypothetical protein [Brucella]ABS14497.1 hypothetical protein Oant_1781 [Brucella anthropi ATCC 49188]AIK43805.1 hypothetical protein DR92_1265 [Brucella anthropi]KAB0571907.1 hypothetical protein F7Q93_09765 [Brucella pituitosa]KAB2739380.1 hypothetical protein F9K90_06405 [Brucella anthropi]KAB2753508.1 hypothetical protein F9K95_06685 [Brucella anthropi]
MNAIQTEYNGYKFRSRTEARWAVFFAGLGIKYEYEKEGFKLNSGPYLPDFWLPKYQMWVEIKADYPSDQEKVLCDELAEVTNFTTLLIFGQPTPEGYGIYISPNSDFPFSGEKYLFGQDRKVDKVLWILEENQERGICLDPDKNDRSGDKYLLGQYASWINAALEGASSARFEHGEKPNV